MGTSLVHFRAGGTRCPSCSGYLQTIRCKDSIEYRCIDCHKRYSYSPRTMEVDAVKEKAFDDFRSWAFLDEKEGNK